MPDGVTMSGSLRWLAMSLVGSVVGTGWWAFVAGSSEVGIALAALVLGTMAAAGTFVAAASAREVLCGVGLVVTAVLVPTYFAYLANVVSVLFGVGLVVHGAARRRPPVARPVRLQH